jgi:hypothetical protein
VAAPFFIKGAGLTRLLWPFTVSSSGVIPFRVSTTWLNGDVLSVSINGFGANAPNVAVHANQSRVVAEPFFIKGAGLTLIAPVVAVHRFIIGVAVHANQSHVVAEPFIEQ